MAVENRSCPLCEQLVPRDVPQYMHPRLKRPMHESCVKLIAEMYINKNFAVAPKSKKSIRVAVTAKLKTPIESEIVSNASIAD
jgi:hypothetical protein